MTANELAEVSGSQSGSKIGSQTESQSESSTGFVAPQRMRFVEPLPLQCGTTIENYELVYETYGTLNALFG